jgi:hypothetical protein
MRYSGTACSTWSSLAATSRQEWVLKKLSPLLPRTMTSLLPLLGPPLPPQWPVVPLLGVRHKGHHRCPLCVSDRLPACCFSHFIFSVCSNPQQQLIQAQLRHSCSPSYSTPQHDSLHALFVFEHANNETMLRRSCRRRRCCHGRRHGRRCWRRCQDG